nr:chloride intracellular channel protein 3 [Anolis sagrei ordinatus]
MEGVPGSAKAGGQPRSLQILPGQLSPMVPLSSREPCPRRPLPSRAPPRPNAWVGEGPQPGPRGRGTEAEEGGGAFWRVCLLLYKSQREQQAPSPPLCLLFGKTATAAARRRRMAAAAVATTSEEESPKLQLFVKASDDGETIGHCPFCQRLFMILLLKGVPFTLTTVDTKRSLDVLKAFAPGAQLPVLLYEGEPKTDTLRIEEFLEETLGPPDFPTLLPRYKESSLAGNDIFLRFSAFIKNPIPSQDEALHRNLLKALWRLDKYLNTPLDYELVRDPLLTASRRRFLDGDQMTLADCALLPKLNIVHVVCQHFRQCGIPKDLRGVWRYLESAAEVKEFKYTCPNSQEILRAYSTVVRPLKQPQTE